MIVQCETCVLKYNNATIPRCPVCNPELVRGLHKFPYMVPKRKYDNRNQDRGVEQSGSSQRP